MKVPSSCVKNKGFSNVINLSSFELSQEQIQVLNKGLTFVPSVPIYHEKHSDLGTRFEIQQYHRRLKLTSFFKNTASTVRPPFQQQSTWSPTDSSLSPKLLKVISDDLDYFDHTHKAQRNKSNLTSKETVALKELIKNKNIVIKPADKGSSVVILDRSEYLWEGYRQLGDKNYYVKLAQPIYPDTIPLVQEVVNQLQERNVITHKQKTYLLDSSEPRARRFYLLPKIHKDKATWPKPNITPAGRPIVSDCGSETYHTAEFIDHFLQPLSVRHPSYIKDTYDFCEKMASIKIPPEAMLFTMDEESLYTNIDITEGLQAIRRTFLKYPDTHRPDGEILKLLEINLTRNDFEFNNEYFLKIKGTAMGWAGF